MSSIRTSKTLFDITTLAFSQYAGRILVANVDGEKITYAQAQQKLQTVQQLLTSVGIEQGDKVAICSENMPHWGIVYLAVTSMGAVAVPILPDFHSNEIHHIVKHSEAKVIFVSDKMNSKLAEGDFTSSLQFVFSLETLTLLEDFMKKSELLSKGCKKFALFKAKLSNTELVTEAFSIKASDLAVIIYTSGTTGQSKGVMLSHSNLVAQVKQAEKLTTILEGDRFLSILPLAHTFECSVGFLVPFSNGATIYYINKTPAPKIILKAMLTVKPTHILSVPLVIEKIYKSKVQASFNKNVLIKYLYNHVPFIRKKLVTTQHLSHSFNNLLKIKKDLVA